MNNLKTILVTLFTVVLLSFSFTGKVKAMEFEDIATFTAVTIKAEVPVDFSQEIVVSLVDEETLVSFNTALTIDNNYTSIITVQSDKVFVPSVVIREGTYKNNLNESYLITGDTAELLFKIEEWNEYELLESDTVIDNVAAEQGSTHGEEKELDEITGLATAESIFNHYLEVASVMEKDSKFKSHLEYYSAAMFKKYFLEADPLNTEDEWEKMSEFERYSRYVLSIKPLSTLYNNTFENENDFIDKLKVEKQMLESIEGGDLIYSEVADVWRWLYKYYLYTGTFYNFYDEYEGIYAGTPLNDESSVIGENKTDAAELKEIEEAIIAEDNLQEEIEEAINGEVEKENMLISWAKNNIITLIIFAIIGVLFVVVAIVARKRNANETE